MDLLETAYCAMNVMYSEIKNPSWPIHTAGRALWVLQQKKKKKKMKCRVVSMPRGVAAKKK